MKKMFFYCLILTSLQVSAQQVRLDPAFGNAGISIVQGTSEINEITIDNFGNIFSAGYKLHGNGSDIYHQILTKHNINGQLDSSFGVNGIVLSEVDYSEMPYAIKLQNDEKIVVAGSYYVGPGSSGPGDNFAYVMRFQNNGKIDSSFGVNGIYKLPNNKSHFNKIILLQDQKILLGGNAANGGLMVKLNSNGTPDTQFGAGGVYYLNDVNFNFIFWDFIQLNDQSIICAGYENSAQGNFKLAMAKMDVQGNYNHGFAQHGKFVLDRHTDPVINVVEILKNVEELPDGKLLVGGLGAKNLILRLTPNGGMDNTFGENGVVEHEYPYNDLVVQADGKIIISGSKIMSEFNYGISTTRFLSNGTLDVLYADSGKFNFDISDKSDYIQCVKLQSDQKLLLGGSSKLNTDANFMLARIDMDATVAGIYTGNIDENDFMIYPNPFNDEFKISSKNGDIVNVRIIDYTGKIIESIPIENKFQSISVDIPSGIYQLLIETKTGTHIQQKIQKH